jgi:hypothetical protein
VAVDFKGKWRVFSSTRVKTFSSAEADADETPDDGQEDEESERKVLDSDPIDSTVEISVDEPCNGEHIVLLATEENATLLPENLSISIRAAIKRRYPEISKVFITEVIHGTADRRFDAAIERELEGLVAKDAFTLIPEDDVPEGSSVLGS